MVVDVVGSDVLFLGIDGGGSKCKARLVAPDGEYLGSGLAGPANPVNGIEKTGEAITRAAALALQEAGFDAGAMANVVAGVALAGVNVPGLWQAINGWGHPFKHMYLTTDLHAACLGAHRGEDGAVIVVGTGSCGYASVGGKTLTLGAHGFQLGDKGSGAWMGLKAVQAVMLADDGLAPATALTGSIRAFYNCQVLELIELFAGARSCEFACLAPLVFDLADRGDATAGAIVNEGAAYIEALAAKLLSLDPPRLSMIGGVSTRLLPRLSAALIERISAPLEQPEVGSVYFAQAEHGGLGAAGGEVLRA
ncbi:ATPase [Exilibacterium tricleocarpae]|uniref:ATPase n=1 Tax=Exilibacterium tricleocarpae TaxID=2591008 RepID=A0A545TNY7_9GAMM|nr:BadF/BadG/BcrA/BcrD ATPase family protein [Exilibacterium tricleocarpae]TQV78922.1 ATPase [Exilibacterium tricleocarpae]